MVSLLEFPNSYPTSTTGRVSVARQSVTGALPTQSQEGLLKIQ